MIKYVEGNLFDLAKPPVIIPHIVNTCGGWGAGFVLPLAAKYPVAREVYLAWHKFTKTQDFTVPIPASVIYEDDYLKLGTIQIIQVEQAVFVVNMAAQTLDGERPLYYNYLVKCMDSLTYYISKYDLPRSIMCPQFGAGLAGGDWNIIEELINDCWIRAGLNVTVVKYKERSS
jgi:hypothetical protein